MKLTPSNDVQASTTYLYTMSVLKVQFEKIERGYNVSIDDGAMVCYESREATWEAIYSAVKDVEFTDTTVEFNGMPVPSMDRLVLLVKYML